MHGNWSVLKKMLFIILFSYILFYCFSIQFFTDVLLEPVWNFLVPEFASLVGEQNVVYDAKTGSGDTRFSWYSSLLFLVLALLISLVALVDHKRANYATFFLMGMIVIRYYLAYQMLVYGLAKFYFVQFPTLTEIRLEKTFGEVTPMGLLWTFMGYSPSYSMFTGLLEILGGVFLLSRRTLTLGGLIVFGVMLNVMMLNFCYDVPVKLFSTHLVFFALIILLLDGRRLFHFFTNTQPTDPFVLPEIVSQDWVKLKNSIKWLILIGYFTYSLSEHSKYYERGKLDEASIEYLQKYPLMYSKFKWIQETPK